MTPHREKRGTPRRLSARQQIRLTEPLALELRLIGLQERFVIIQSRQQPPARALQGTATGPIGVRICKAAIRLQIYAALAWASASSI